MTKPFIVLAGLAASILAAGATEAEGPASREARLLTLGDAVAIALEHNPALVAAGYEKERAVEGVVQAKARLAPKIELAEIASYTTNPTLVFSNLLGQEGFGAQNFSIPSLNEPDPLSNFNGRISLTQPLYAGGQIRAGMEVSRHTEGAARAEESRARQEAIFRTTDTYQRVLLARHQRLVAESAREAAASHLGAAENLVEAGLAVSSDVMRVKVRLAEIEEMIIRARAGEQVARAALEAVMGMKPDSPYDLVEPMDEPPAPPDVEAAARTALQQRPDLASAREGAAAAGQAARGARGGRRPQAGLYAAYDINNETPFGSTGQNWTVMLNLTWNVFDGSGSASRVRQGIAEEARAATLVSGFESQVVLEVRQAHAELTGAFARRDAALGAVAQAEEGLRIVRDRYENGLAAITDLLDQETALTDARARAVQAGYDRRSGAAALQLATGTLGEKPEEVQP